MSNIWTEEQKLYLDKCWRDTTCKRLMANLPGKTWEAIRCMARRRRLGPRWENMISLTAASNIAGYDKRCFQRILTQYVEWRNALPKKQRRLWADPSVCKKSYTSSANCPQMVYVPAISAAVSWWNTLETPQDAAARHGLKRKRLLARMQSAGIRSSLSVGRFIRLSPEKWDEIVQTLNKRYAKHEQQ